MITVLIVDDHSMVAESFRRALANEADLEVVGVAHTVAEAHTTAIDRRPDVVLMDYALPDGDGVSAAAVLVRQPLFGLAPKWRIRVPVQVQVLVARKDPILPDDSPDFAGEPFRFSHRCP